MELILQVIFSSVFSGLMLSAAIPNELYLFGCPIYTLLALIPLYLIFNKIRDFKTAFLAFFLQTLTTHLISSFWLAYFKDFAIFTLGASALGTACIGGGFGLFFFIPYYTTDCQNKLNEYSAAFSLRHSTVFRILYFTAVYTLYEWAKSAGFLGYPWGTVSSAMLRWPIIMQLASITGTYGITFLIVMFNAIAAETLMLYYGNVSLQSKKQQETIQTAKLLGVLFVFVFIHGLYQYDKPRKPVKELTIITVQQNSDPWKENSDQASILASQKLTKAKINELEQLEQKADLVVWSEGCLNRAFPNAETYYSWYPSESALAKFVKEINVPCIFGGSVIKNHKIVDGEKVSFRKEYYNSTLLYDADGKYRGYYAKNHLVPFAEVLPFIEIPAVHTFMQKVVGISAGWTPGDQYVYFDVPCRVTENFKLPAVKDIDLTKSLTEQKAEEKKPYTVRIATPICFDDAFTDIMRPLFLNGSELFINLTDDSWSRTKSSEIQHFAIASYRAIEYRTTLVRSSNAGYSVVVDPSGKVLADLPLFEETALSYNVPVFSRKMTTYARFGNWLPYLCLIVFAVCAVWSFLDFSPYDYIPSERKSKKDKKKKKKNSKNKK